MGRSLSITQLFKTYATFKTTTINTTKKQVLLNKTLGFLPSLDKVFVMSLTLT